MSPHITGSKARIIEKTEVFGHEKHRSLFLSVILRLAVMMVVRASLFSVAVRNDVGFDLIFRQLLKNGLGFGGRLVFIVDRGRNGQPSLAHRNTNGNNNRSQNNAHESERQHAAEYA